MHKRPMARQGGYSLIEAMMTFVIVSFGMLGIIGLQSTMSRNADTAKQRGEATLLAQQRIETMRSFTHIDAVAATPADPDRSTEKLAWNEWADAASAGPVVVADKNNPITASGFSNTAFTRTWTVGGSKTDPMRPVSVNVAWTDRVGKAHSITMNTVISQSDPAYAAALGFPLPNNTNLKLPKNRDINIPVPAIDLGKGKSAYQISPTLAVVFDNISSSVVEKCTSTVTAESYANDTAGCTTFNAYIVAGYVTGEIANTTTSPPAPRVPSGIHTGGVTFDSADGKSISCAYEIATDQNSSALIAASHYYLCVIPVQGKEGAWSGTIKLGGVPTSSNYKVCRYEYAGTETDSIETKNSRNVQPYQQVKTSLDNQNYHLVNSTGDSCPVVQSLQTKLHQDCRNNGAASSEQCPTTISK